MGAELISRKDLMSVSEFARITRTTRETLRHYDKIGLLSPEVRGDNKYRYYSIKQLALCNMIRLMQRIGLPLSDIQAMKDHRTPELAMQILTQQIAELSKKTEKLMNARRLLNTMMQTIQAGLDADEEVVSIQFMPSEQIILGKSNDYSKGRTAYDALSAFYSAMSVKCTDSEYDLHYPVWGVFLEERIKQGDWKYPDHYYFYNPNGKDQRPAALYAIGHMRTGYGQSEKLYGRMTEFIEQNGYEICGDAYEEYPISELCTTDDSGYLLRLMITVREAHIN